MWRYRSKVLIEVAAHDHLADFRVHSAGEIFNTDSNCLDVIGEGEGYFLGKLIAPSVSPDKYSEPGYTTMVYDQGILSNLKMVFLELQSTLGPWRDLLPEDATFHTIDYEYFGLLEVSNDGIAALHANLK